MTLSQAIVQMKNCSTKAQGVARMLEVTRSSRAFSSIALSSSIYSHRESTVQNDCMRSREKIDRVGSPPKRWYNFASSSYASCFQDLPKPDIAFIRKSAMDYLDGFDKQLWYDEPVCSILKGEKLTSPPENLFVTEDALSNPNGHQHFASQSQVQSLVSHIQNYKTPYKDIRPQIRTIEQKLLNEHAGFLIGNQCVDFQKQDGITEIEESVMANKVERCLNDKLLEDESSGKVIINRKPIYISCVSNFTNFLDLFRKTIRSLELGIPCVILGRSNTVQHSYRWTELLVDMLQKEGIDPGMLTYLSCTLDDIKYITQSCRDSTGMLYSTCSRELAASIKSGYPNTITSTGGPNTLYTTEWTPGVQDAVRMSASIESSGQCTALRHCVVPSTVTSDDVEKLFDSVEGIDKAENALRDQKFDCVFENHGGSVTPADGKDSTYTKHGTKDVYYKLGTSMPDDNIIEYWRKLVVDITTATSSGMKSEEAEPKLKDLAKWLNTNQPISLAVNAPRSDAFDLARSLFEKTALVVYTVGSTDDDGAPPAMTCQARPQEAEVFGEFPPRKDLQVFTKYPVVVPSSTPSYDTMYDPKYLESLSSSNLNISPDDAGLKYVQSLINDIDNPVTRGFCIELFNYIHDATSQNPKRGFGTSRTALWGIQRTPILDDIRTVIRCGDKDAFDALVPKFLPFYATNAREQVELSIHPGNIELLNKLQQNKLVSSVKVVVEENKEFENTMRTKAGQYYNIVEVGEHSQQYPLVGQFMSLYFPLGHIKSTKSDDTEFLDFFGKSDKWLQVHRDSE